MDTNELLIKILKEIRLLRMDFREATEMVDGIQWFALDPISDKDLK